MSETALWLVKAVHVATISLWAAGLLTLPFLLSQRRAVAGAALHRLHALTRFLYVKLVSPAAFVAILSGTALIFLQATFVEWFSAKLVFVGLMVVLHIVTGLAVVRVFTRAHGLGAVSATALTLGQLAAIGPILWLVLDKPMLDSTAIGPALFTPGGLARLLGPLTASETP